MNRIKTIAITPTFNFYLLFPEGLLSNYVSMIWASDGNPPFTQERIIPDGASVLLFNFGSRVVSMAKNTTKEVKKTLFTGAFSYFSNMNYTPLQIHKQIGVIFKPGCASFFLKKPAQEFKNIAVEINEMNEKLLDEIYEKLEEIESIENRLFKLEQLFTEILKKNYEENLIHELLKIIKLNPTLSVDEIVKKTGYSHQHLNRILGKYAGLNAKGLQKVFRINSAMQTIKQLDDTENLTNVAYQFSYFDQAHFIHDFRELTGMSPKEYRLIEQPTTNRVIYL